MPKTEIKVEMTQDKSCSNPEANKPQSSQAMRENFKLIGMSV